MQGYASAQNNAGRLVYIGVGGSQSNIGAYVWFHCAAAQGNKNGKKNRAMVRAKLDPDSLAVAENLAEEFYELYVQPFQ